MKSLRTVIVAVMKQTALLLANSESRYCRVGRAALAAAGGLHMRDGISSKLMTTGLLAILCLYGSGCSSSNSSPATSGVLPDAAVSLGGGGAIGTGGTGAGGTAGLTGSRGSSSNAAIDAGLGPDAAARTDGALSLKLEVGPTPDLAPQPDAGPKPDMVAQPDAGGKADAPLSNDAGTLPDTAPNAEAGSSNDATTATDAELVLYGLSPGAYCYTITSVAPGFNDGCAIGVASLQGAALVGNYDIAMGIMTLGSGGSLGSGVIRYNVGTLVRSKSKMTDSTLPQCTWNQADTTTLTMTDTNKFTVSVVEEQDSITSACGMTFSSCRSTWTWTMEIASTKVAPGCH